MKKGVKPARSIPDDGFFERADIDLVLPVHRNDAQSVASQPSQIHGLRDPTVGARRGVGDQAFAGGGDTLAAHAGTDRVRARHQDGDQVRHGGAGHEQAAGVSGKPNSSRTHRTTCRSTSMGI